MKRGAPTMTKRCAPSAAVLFTSLALAFMTAGCVRFGAKPPAQLITIASEANVPVGSDFSGTAASALVVEEPATGRFLQTQRVLVNDGPNAIAYVKDALWADIPARQFRRLLAETISARSGILVLTPGQFATDPAGQLKGELIAFGVDAARGQALVTYDASLLSADGATIARQRFSATAPVGKIEAGSVAAPVSRAANLVAAQVADWVKTKR
jgi:cholesterol transport system auxiliary component